MTLATLAEANQPKARKELRVWERFACDVPVNCQPPGAFGSKDIKWTARIRDVSSGGLCLILRRRFEPGAGLTIDLPGEDGESPCTLLARVMRVRAEGDGSWALGCAFISRLSDDEIIALRRFGPPQPPAETTPAVCLKNVLLRGRLPGGQLVQWWIKRLDVEIAWPPRAGSTVGLRVAGADGNVHQVPISVGDCRPTAEGWQLEAVFVGTPPDAFLRPGNSVSNP